MKKIILIISCTFFALLVVYAQSAKCQFGLIKYKGKIREYPITMFLTFYPGGSYSGYYYYDNSGQLFQIEKGEKLNTLMSFPIEQYPTKNKNAEDKELFAFVDTLSSDLMQHTGTWKKGNRTLPFLLNKDSSQMEWKYFSNSKKGRCEDEYFTSSEETISLVYPSIQSSKILNECILTKFISDKPLIQYLNSTSSYHTVIYEDIEKFCTGFWETFLQGDVVFYTDSVLTYRLKSFTYANNGDSYDYMISMKISSGKILTYEDMFKINTIDSVLSILKNKYKKIILEETDEYNTIDMIDKSSNIYVAPNGIYFSNRFYKLAPFVHLFMSFKELEDFLNEDFKNLIKI